MGSRCRTAPVPAPNSFIDFFRRAFVEAARHAGCVYKRGGVFQIFQRFVPPCPARRGAQRRISLSERRKECARRVRAGICTAVRKRDRSRRGTPPSVQLFYLFIERKGLFVVHEKVLVLVVEFYALYAAFPNACPVRKCAFSLNGWTEPKATVSAVHWAIAKSFTFFSDAGTWRCWSAANCVTPALCSAFPCRRACRPCRAGYAPPRRARKPHARRVYRGKYACENR